jgi:hypothetical protein
MFSTRLACWSWPVWHVVCAGSCLFSAQPPVWVDGPTSLRLCGCGCEGLCVLDSVVVLSWWMCECCCPFGVGDSSHTVADQAEPQSSTLW